MLQREKRARQQDKTAGACESDMSSSSSRQHAQSQEPNLLKHPDQCCDSRAKRPCKGAAGQHCFGHGALVVAQGGAFRP